MFDLTDPGVTFSDAQWDEIAKSILPCKLPAEMKREIADALFEYELMDDGRRLASDRTAAKGLALLLQRCKLGLNAVLGEPIFEEIVDDLEDLIKHIREIQETADLVLKKLSMSKGGRPPEVHRDKLIQHLVNIFAKYSGRPPGLSRTRDRKNQDRLNDSGPYFRFTSTILRLRGLPTNGLGHVIARAAKKTKIKNPY